MPQLADNKRLHTSIFQAFYGGGATVRNATCKKIALTLAVKWQSCTVSPHVRFDPRASLFRAGSCGNPSQPGLVTRAHTVQMGNNEKPVLPGYNYRSVHHRHSAEPTVFATHIPYGCMTDGVLRSERMRQCSYDDPPWSIKPELKQKCNRSQTLWA